jgi:UDP-N-acetylmuramate dehydrogenase
VTSLIRRDVDLSTLNTLRLPSRAAAFASITRADQLGEVSRQWQEESPAGRRFILGGGSNLVLTQDFKGLVLQMALPGRQMLGEDDAAFYVAGAAGEDWNGFVAWTLAQGWPGLENLSLIPGTVGAAPVQNIGAYGRELAEVLHEVEAIDLDSGETRRFDRTACRFAYRDSVFKQEGWHRNGRMAIVRVVFRLPKKWTPLTRYADLQQELDARKIAAPSPVQVADAIVAIRRRKLPDPATLPNAGSFFQNPVVDLVTATKLAAHYPDMPRYRTSAGDLPSDRIKLAAGWLIEQAGWKGRSFGPVGMYEKQALILVNHEPGTARGTDVGMLAEAVRMDVQRKFGVWLVPEPVFI